MSSPLFRNFNKFVASEETKLAKAIAEQVVGRSGGRVTRYSSGGAITGGSLWNRVVSKLGAAGQVLNSLLRPNGKPIAPDAQRELDKTAAALQALIERGTVAEKPREVREEVRISSNPPRHGGGNGTISPPSGGDDWNPQPLVDGPIEVQSSNVFSISFQFAPTGGKYDPGDLFVCFLGGQGKNRAGPGATYQYFQVPGYLWESFKNAPSKGKWVWRELRVLGTVSGHVFDYALVGTGPSGYIPRAAIIGKRGMTGEVFSPRRFQGRQSSLPEQSVRRGGQKELTPEFKRKARQAQLMAGRRK